MMFMMTAASVITLMAVMLSLILPMWREPPWCPWISMSVCFKKSGNDRKRTRRMTYDDLVLLTTIHIFSIASTLNPKIR